MAAGAAAAAAAAIANAIKASGVLVRVEPEEFAKVLGLTKEPLIVIAEGGFFSKNLTFDELTGKQQEKSCTPLN